MRFASLLLSLSSLLAVSDAQIRARRVVQGRAAYNGGWALGIPGSSCPADAPVACSTSDSDVNPTCCPNGQTCFGLLNPHCCPTDVDCQNVVENLPVCANSTWDMYILNLQGRTFFCCEPGQYGVLPISGYAGICEPDDQPVASSLIATAGTQAGGAAATTLIVQAATTSTVTSSLEGGGVTTILTTIPGTTSTGTATQTGTGSAAGSTDSSSSGNPISKAAGKTGISTGAIVGIVVGALLVILIALVLYLLFKKRKGNEYRGDGTGGDAPVYNPVPQAYHRGNPPDYTGKFPVTESAVPAQGYGESLQTAQNYAATPQSHAVGSVSPMSSGSQPGYGGSPPPLGHGPSQPPPNTVEAPQRWEGRVEMG